MRYRTAAALPAGLQRTKRGRWRFSPCPLTAMTDANWWAFLDGREVASARYGWGNTAMYLGWLKMSTEAGGAGLNPSETQSMAWLAVPDYIEAYLDWRKARSGRRNQGANQALAFLTALVRPRFGFLRQHPEWQATLPKRYRKEKWEAMCDRQFDLLEQLASSYYNEIEVSRDSFEPLRHLIDQKNPMDSVADMIQRMCAARPVGVAPSKEAIWARDLDQDPCVEPATSPQPRSSHLASRQHGRALSEERQILVDQNPEAQVQELVWRGSGLGTHDSSTISESLVTIGKALTIMTKVSFYRIAPEAVIETPTGSDETLVKGPMDLLTKLKPKIGIVVASWDESRILGCARRLGLVLGSAEGGVRVRWVPSDAEYRPKPSGRVHWRTKPFFGFAKDVADRYLLAPTFAEAFTGFIFDEPTREVPVSKQARPSSSPTGGYVYLVRSEHGIKIGKSINVKSRTRLFEVKLPFPITVEHYAWFEDYSHAERSLHRKYHLKRLEGEWFDLTDADVEHIKTLGKAASLSSLR